MRVIPLDLCGSISWLRDLVLGNAGTQQCSPRDVKHRVIGSANRAVVSPALARTAPSSQHYPLALDSSEEPWPGELSRISPIFDCNGNRLYHDPRVEIRVIG